MRAKPCVRPWAVGTGSSAVGEQIAIPKRVYTGAPSVGVDWSSVCSCRAVILSWSWGCCWVHHVSSRMLWMDTGSLKAQAQNTVVLLVGQLECMDVCLGLDEEPSERLWAVTKEQSTMGDIAEGICCWPPDQVHEALFGQIKAASHSQSLDPLSDFNLTTSWGVPDLSDW